MSGAYYALFHTLCRQSADLVVGKTKALRSNPAWRQVYRALEHGTAKNQCKNNRIISRFPKGIEDFASLFVEAQEERHKADYDPGHVLKRSEAVALIGKVEKTIARFNRIGIADRRAFVVFVILKVR